MDAGLQSGVRKGRVGDEGGAEEERGSCGGCEVRAWCGSCRCDGSGLQGGIPCVPFVPSPFQTLLEDHERLKEMRERKDREKKEKEAKRIAALVEMRDEMVCAGLRGGACAPAVIRVWFDLVCGLRLNSTWEQCAGKLMWQCTFERVLHTFVAAPFSPKLLLAAVAVVPLHHRPNAPATSACVPTSMTSCVGSLPPRV